MLEVANDGCGLILEVHEMVYLMEGQRRSKSGSTIGYRFILNTLLLSEDEREAVIAKLSGAPIPGTNDIRTVFNLTPLSTPVGFIQAQETPEVGILTLNVRLSAGYGAIGAKQFKSIKENAIKDTKNVLNISNPKYNATTKYPYLNEAISSVFSNPLWYKVKILDEKQDLPRGSVGGSYEISYNLKDLLDKLVEGSKGVWWQSLTGDEYSPRLTVDCTQSLDVPQNPMTWYPHRPDNLFMQRINSAVDVQRDDEGLIQQINWNTVDNDCTDSVVGWESRRSNDDFLIDDIQNVCETILGKQEDFEFDDEGNRVSTGVYSFTPAPIEDLTIDDGLTQGNEEFLVREIVLKPWIVREFIHLLQLFLLTRTPRDWLNGESEIRLRSHSLQEP